MARATLAPPTSGDNCAGCHRPLEVEPVNHEPTDYHTVLPEHAAGHGANAGAGHYHAGCCTYAFCVEGVHAPSQAEVDNIEAGRPAGSVDDEQGA